MQGRRVDDEDTQTGACKDPEEVVFVPVSKRQGEFGLDRKYLEEMRFRNKCVDTR